MCGIFAILNKNNITDNINLSFEKIQLRGPEFSHISVENNNIFGFHRLSINGINEKSNQPFYIDNIILICNGEIYNFKKLYEELNIEPKTDSDCEIIIHMYKLFGIEYTLKCLDGVFAFILYDLNINELYVARDPYGVRPLYKFSDYNNCYYFSSNLKGIYDLYYEQYLEYKKININVSNCYKINQFIPGTYCKFKNINNKLNITINNKKYTGYPCSHIEINNENMINKLIGLKLSDAVKKRVIDTCERPIGCLLSGGLDSSLITAFVKMYYKGENKLKTFSIGLPHSEDLKYAKIVADYLDTDHHEIIVTEDDFFNAIEDVIKTIESYDTTTVRASVGNYLIGKYIREHTECKVIFNGDGSDELTGGYLYFNNVPNEYEFDKECTRLLDNICYFDVLRSDRCISEHGLEPRTPFLDKTWVEFYLSINKNIRNHNIKNKCEKYLLRNAISNEYIDILPYDIIWRTKEAFSDGVSSMNKSWFQVIQEKIKNKCEIDIYLNEELHNLMKTKNTELIINIPNTMEQVYYRYLFNKYYKYADNCIPYFWMPKYSNANDASARTLNIYKTNNSNI